MSHIVSFRVEGLTGRKKPLELELNRDTNIFFGLNGSGKTSLLKIFHAAMANNTKILAAVPFTAAEVSIYSMTWKKVFTRSIKKIGVARDTGSRGRRVIHRELTIGREVVTAEEEIRPEEGLTWTCTPATPKEASSSRWAHEYLPTSRLHVSDEDELYGLPIEYTRQNRPWLTEEQLDSFFARSVEQLWSRYSAQVLGAVRKAQEQGLASILRAVLSPESASGRRRTSKLTVATAYERVENFLKRQGSASILGTQAAFEKRYAADATLQDVVQDIDLVEDKIKDAMTSRNTLQELITRMFSGNKKICFTDESIEVNIPSGEKIGLASLSSGEKHLLLIFVQSLLVGESSMMIDEPEISMHVDWQKDLIRSVRALNPEAQLIFATHSPEIMADIPDDKIFRI
ncbi:MAG: AAA family ATPase [Thermodesulfovibrionales bacterium]